MSDGTPPPNAMHPLPDAATALLWGLTPRRTRGPKPTLSVDELIQAAVALADGEGLAACSMRAVAKQLGVGTMTLYRYVPGQSELIALMVDRVAGEQDSAVDVVDGWRDKLTYLAYQQWAMFQRHPWLLEVPLGRTPPGPNATAAADARLAAALETGLPVAEAVLIFRAVDQLVVGTARASTENTAFVQRTGVPLTEWWHRQTQVLDPFLRGGTYPALQEVLDANGFDDDIPPDDTTDGFAAEFDSVLSLLLDGIAARVAPDSHSSHEPRP
jgi:AcrR family transcriptional regulator